MVMGVTDAITHCLVLCHWSARIPALPLPHCQLHHPLSAMKSTSSALNKEDIVTMEALEKEIDDRKRFIASLPDFTLLSSRSQLVDRANLVKQLAAKEEEYELLLECERMKSVVWEYEELHPPATNECPICLETVQIRTLYLMAIFSCWEMAYVPIAWKLYLRT